MQPARIVWFLARRVPPGRMVHPGRREQLERTRSYLDLRGQLEQPGLVGRTVHPVLQDLLVLLEQQVPQGRQEWV